MSPSSLEEQGSCILEGGLLTLSLLDIPCGEPDSSAAAGAHRKWEATRPDVKPNDDDFASACQGLRDNEDDFALACRGLRPDKQTPKEARGRDRWRVIECLARTSSPLRRAQLPQADLPGTPTPVETPLSIRMRKIIHQRIPRVPSAPLPGKTARRQLTLEGKGAKSWHPISGLGVVKAEESSHNDGDHACLVIAAARCVASANPSRKSMAVSEHVPVEVASSTSTRCSTPTRLRSPSTCSNLSANACSPRASLSFDIAAAVDHAQAAAPQHKQLAHMKPSRHMSWILKASLTSPKLSCTGLITHIALDGTPEI
jgi:hypothetical protein